MGKVLPFERPKGPDKPDTGFNWNWLYLPYWIVMVILSFPAVTMIVGMIPSISIMCGWFWVHETGHHNMDFINNFTAVSLVLNIWFVSVVMTVLSPQWNEDYCNKIKELFK